MRKKIFLLLFLILFLTGCGSSGKSQGLGEAIGSPISSGQEMNQGNSQGTNPSQGISETSPRQEGSMTTVSGASYTFSLPKDFTEMELEGFECFYTAEDGSNVNLNVQAKDASFETVSAQLLNSSLTSVLSQTYGTDITVTDAYFSRDPVCGYPAYQYSFSYTLKEDEVRQLVIGIDADRCYIFTYTDMTGDWMELFEASADTILFTTFQGGQP